ncbi:MAG: Cys-Gln thioester bond-forming surface protein [Thermodesulfobacteriota bacterium]
MYVYRHYKQSRTVVASVLAAALLAGLLGFAAKAEASQLEVLNWTLGHQIQYSLNSGSNKNAWTAEMHVSLDDFSDILAYCIDLGQTINKNVEYNVTVDPVQTHPVSTLQAAWLLGHYAPGLGLATAGYSLQTNITALQVAIWEVIYDHANTDLTSGSFVLKNVYSSESAQVQTLANQYLASLPADIGSTGLTFAGATRSSAVQDLVVGATPEPGSLLLFGSALAAGLGWRRRRRQRA